MEGSESERRKKQKSTRGYNAYDKPKRRDSECAYIDALGSLVVLDWLLVRHDEGDELDVFGLFQNIRGNTTNAENAQTAAKLRIRTEMAGSPSTKRN